IIGKGKETELVTSETDLSEASKPEDEFNKRALILAQNKLMLYDLSTNKTVTIADNSSATYSALAWKNKEEFSYSECTTGKCLIKTYSLKTNKVVENYQVKVDTIKALRWSHQGK